LFQQKEYLALIEQKLTHMTLSREIAAATQPKLPKPIIEMIADYSLETEPKASPAKIAVLH